MRSLALLFALAACTPPSAPMPASAVARTTPGPTIQWSGNEHRYVVSGLPAVARDGSVLVVQATDSDGGRGYPNLRLEVHDRADRVVAHQIFVSNDWEELAPSGEPGPALAARIADANRELAGWQRQHDLVPMHAFTRRPGDDVASGDGLVVAWTGAHLHVAHEAVTDVDGTSWLARGDSCEHPAFLAGVYHAPTIDVIAVELGFRGTDTCWEPGNTWHFVTW